MMNKTIATYIQYLKSKGLAANTLESYQRDLKQAMAFFEKERQINEWEKVDQYAIMDLVNNLKGRDRSAATINRLLSALRRFYRYLICHRGLRFNPLELVDNIQPATPQAPEILTESETQRLLRAPDSTTLLGCRDHVMLLVMAATGMRVSELVQLSLKDLHLDIQMVRSGAGSKQERLIPLSTVASGSLQEYLTRVRKKLARPGEDAVFVNAHGHRLTRQGVWKNLKQLVKVAQIDKAVTPQTLRYSFAVRLLNNGADSRLIQAMLGYSEMRMLKPYLKMSPQEMVNSYRQHQPRL